MEKFFNDSFFRFLLGFVAILTVSFVVTFAIDFYADSQVASVEESVGGEY